MNWIPLDPYTDENPFGPPPPGWEPRFDPPVPIKDPKEGD